MKFYRFLYVIFDLLVIPFISFSQDISYQNAFPNLSFNFPVEIQSSVDGTNRMFVLEQSGRIKVFPNSNIVTTDEQSVFLDISSSVAYSAGQEVGLLGMAFHPNYITNGYVFVYYIDSTSNYRINIVRYKVSDTNPNALDTSSATSIAQFTKNQSDSNHNGGKIAFGPDGFLYISIGDGGGGGDPQGNGQNLNTVFGSLLRIDIDIDGNNPIENNPDLPNGNYEIPSDNPRVGQTGLDELYAWGIRNTWKFSFDLTGNLWGADVGQNVYEEINLINKGGNYGWNKFEANSQPSYGTGTTLATNPDIKPIFNYDHNAGDLSITGGYVYRGSLTNSILQNRYIYGDYISGRVWSLNYNASNGSTSNSLLFKTDGEFISSFGEDEQGELYFSGYGPSAKIYKLIEEVTGPVTNVVNGVGEWKSITSSTDGIVECILESEDQKIYLGGSFLVAGGQTVNNIAILNPDGLWQSIGGGSNGSIYSMAISENGLLFAAGDFNQIGGINANNIAYWDGTTWSSMGSGTDGPISKIKFDNNGNLFVGGIFTSVNGITANNIAKWQNGIWSSLTDATTSISGTNNEIRSIAIDESNILYVGGNFDTAGGNSAARIARWDGTNWSALNQGTSGFVQAIAITSNYIYAGGNFALAGDQTVNRISRFNRSTSIWEKMGDGLSGNVNTIEIKGSNIYVGGTFETASDITNTNKVMNNIARWSEDNGWEALGLNTNVGVNTRVNSMVFTKNDTELFVGGNFSIAGNLNAENIALWSTGFCSEDSIIPEYQVNGTWLSGSNTLTVNEGDSLIISMLPNNKTFILTLPDGTQVNGDYSLLNIIPSKSGTYTITTTQGCTENLQLTVISAIDTDEDNDGVGNDEDICSNTPYGETVNENGCSPSQLDDDIDGVFNDTDECSNTTNGETVDTEGCSSSQLDEDNDGIPNNIDQCPSTPNGAIVDLTGCIVATSLDDDNDGVNDELDSCPNTPFGQNVNSVGCTILNSFPSNQFKITSTGTTCIDINNGSIIIESITLDYFLAILTGPNTNNSKSFSENLNFTDLENGEYNLCITSVEFPNFQNCSKIIISEPTPLDVELDFDPSTNSVTLKMQGAKEYTVEINGKSMQTESKELILPLSDEINNISVITNQLCQGKFEDIVILENSFLIYPNPVNESLSIDLKSLTSDTMEIAIFTEAGLLAHSETYLVKQSKIELNTSALSTGIYFLRLKNDKINKTFKLIKQ